MSGAAAFLARFNDSSEYSGVQSEADDDGGFFLEDSFASLSFNDPNMENNESGFQLILAASSGADAGTMDAQSQGRLLLVSLLENFCDMYDRRPEKNRRLYLSLCRRLSTMGILQSSDFVDESVNVRKAYRSVFKDLVLEAMESIKKVSPSSLHLD